MKKENTSVQTPDIISDVLEWLWIAKPEWKAPRDVISNKEKHLVADVVKEELDELKDALNSDNKEEIKDAVADLIYTALNSIAVYGISIDEFKEYFQKVTKSNYSKYCNTEKEALDTCEAYYFGTHPDKLGGEILAYYKKIGNKFVIFRVSDNKILKSINYQKLT